MVSGADEHGKKIQQQNALEDPAADATRALQQALVHIYGMSPAPGLQGIPDDGVATLDNATTPARYLLSVRAREWGVERYTLRPGRYYVKLALRMRLVDTVEHVLLAQGSCDRDPSYDGDAPAKDQLLANQGALLKQLLKTEVDDCVEHLEVQTFGFTTQGQ